MNKELLSYYGKPIEDGQQYFVVYRTSDYIGIEIGGEPVSSRAHVAARFLSKSGAEKYIGRKPMKERSVGEFSKKVVLPEEPVKVKTKEELFEEEMKTLDRYDQLLRVEDRAGFDLWMKRNKYRFNNSYNRDSHAVDIKLLTNNSSANPIIQLGGAFRGVPYCCGGREFGSHYGTCEMDLMKVTEEVRFILFKYLAEEFDTLLRANIPNYGIISYVKNPGVMSEPSARIGMMMNFSKYFDNVSKFRNPNSSRELDIYVVNENWPTNL